MHQHEVYEPILWLQEAGYSAYLVGNQVRDQLLGINDDGSDVDISTSATPKDVASLLRRHNIFPGMMDEKFGIVSFTYAGLKFETATFRTDIYDGDFSLIKRYPDAIKFVSLAATDAVRRDLTINAIYFNPKTKKYLDYTGGLDDLKSKTIRMIGDPEIRFKEDPVRILRAIRFKYLLGFRYDPATARAITKHSGLVKKLSPAIIKKELQKLQTLPNYSIVRSELVKLDLVLVP